ncbi:MAG: 30S ribosomal protein S3 [Oscillospiraceae bacterium]|nr:30S ribosomal protein S3 [Oscillospiraceae bacterium]
MGQKIHPHGLRVGVINDWDSRWYARKGEFADLLVEDYKLRRDLKKQFYAAGIPKIEIERDASRVRINIHCAKPGIIIGKGGAEIEKLRLFCEKSIGKPVSINIVEVRDPDTDAQLVAENIASQLEKRTAFRRAMKQAIGRAMRLGVKGIKTMVSGRLNGAEIARSEMYHEGTIPLQTIRADIDYGFAEASTTYGKIGVKVWIYKGEVLAGEKTARGEIARRKPREGRDRDDRRPRRDGDRRPRQYDNNRGPRPEGPGGYRGPRPEGAANAAPRAPRQEGGSK